MATSVRARPCRNLGATLATRIHLCVDLTVEVEGQRVESRLRGRQGRLLFAYLVLNRTRRVRRDELVGAVWADGAPSSPEGALSALLSKLRQLVLLEGRTELRIALS